MRSFFFMVSLPHLIAMSLICKNFFTIGIKRRVYYSTFKYYLIKKINSSFNLIYLYNTINI